MKIQKIEPLTWIKICIIVLMLLCLIGLPYGFYNLVRFVSMIAFLALAINGYRKKQKAIALVYGAIALMFQPFFKLVLGRDVWITVDILVAIFLIWVIVKNKEVRVSLIDKKS